MNSVAVIINSCYKFYETTTKKIIESAKNAKIPSENIYVVVGECDYESEIIKTDDYNIVYCKYYNVDYNGAIYFTQTKSGVEELKKYTHFFYTHDTSILLEHFWDRIKEFSKICDMYIKLENMFSKNIGLFNVNWFINNKSELFSYFINYDKTLVLDYKGGSFPNKEIIYSNFKNLPRWLNEDCMFLFDENFEPTGMYFINNNKPVYKEAVYLGQERLVSVYNDPGLIKYNKNWGQQDFWDLTL